MGLFSLDRTVSKAALPKLMRRKGFLDDIKINRVILADEPHEGKLGWEGRPRKFSPVAVVPILQRLPSVEGNGVPNIQKDVDIFDH